jgi:hypothetical protein
LRHEKEWNFVETNRNGSAGMEKRRNMELNRFTIEFVIQQPI